MGGSTLQKSPHLLLKEFFGDSTRWWDNRHTKIGPHFGLAQSLHDQAHLCIDEVTVCLASLRACAKNKDLRKGTRIHEDLVAKGLVKNCLDALVTMYAKCGSLGKAGQLLDIHKSKDVCSWTALITGYAQAGHGQEALNCFERMQRHGLSPDAVTFASLLRACASIKTADQGERIHHEIARLGLLGNDIILGNALVDMYVKCCQLGKAHIVLQELPVRDSVSWNTLIAGYAQQNKGEKALHCYEQMQCEGLSPNAVTFCCILKSCGMIGAPDKGEQIHDAIATQGLFGSNIMLDTALVDMYAKCGALLKAHHVHEELPNRDVVSWSALIGGYAEQGQGKEALKCFEGMRREGLSPNAVTFLCMLKVCSSIGAAEQGERIHDEIARQGLLGDKTVLGNALVDMYAKCGELVKAEQVLKELPIRGVVSWNALITGYAEQGQCEQAMSCFEGMEHEGLSPDAVTLSSVLNACSHLGLVEDAELYFKKMNTQFGIKPDLGHYTCMIDLFARAGHLGKAVEVIKKLPCSEYSSDYILAVWSTLLDACRKWGDVNVGRWAFEHAIQVDERDALAYILMANIYAAAGMLEDAKTIEALRMKNKAWKSPMENG